MDFLRRCVRVQSRLFRDDPTLYWIRWTFCRPGAKKYLGPQINGSLVWWPGRDIPSGTLGEVQGTWQTIPHQESIYSGVCFRGDPSWFAEGAPVAILSEPAPPPQPCCRPLVPLSEGGLSLNGSAPACYLTIAAGGLSADGSAALISFPSGGLAADGSAPAGYLTIAAGGLSAGGGMVVEPDSGLSLDGHAPVRRYGGQSSQGGLKTDGAVTSRRYAGLSSQGALRTNGAAVRGHGTLKTVGGGVSMDGSAQVRYARVGAAGLSADGSVVPHPYSVGAAGLSADGSVAPFYLQVPGAGLEGGGEAPPFVFEVPAAGLSADGSGGI